MKKEYTLILSAILIITIMSCSRGEAYFKFKKVDKGVWDVNSALTFNVDSALIDPNNNYDIQFDIIYSSVYPYHDLWMSVEHNLLDTIFMVDTLKVTLIDKYGKRLGNGNAGLYQISLPYKSDLNIDSIYSYTINVEHIMRDNKLKGIEKIGLKISDSGVIRSRISNLLDRL